MKHKKEERSNPSHIGEPHGDILGSLRKQKFLPARLRRRISLKITRNIEMLASAIVWLGRNHRILLNNAIHGNDTIADQVHLAWVDDPATTLTVVWRTFSTTVPSEVQYRACGTANWQVTYGGERPSGTWGKLHEVTLTALQPSTAYEYRVRGPHSQWSDTFTARTAPQGDEEFTAIYVANTGLIGRMDDVPGGTLATGTQQVIQEIAALTPNLILAGGAYVFFDTDKRFVTRNNTIDQWFNQWEPVFSAAPVMPTYGQHERALGEKLEYWTARFPIPQTSGLFSNATHQQGNYSFDVGNVHFISILMTGDRELLTDEQMHWIEEDSVAARQNGQQWTIAYCHTGPYGDGVNHKQNLALRKQMGPLFERLNIDLAFCGRDQAYERTYPLTDIGKSDSPASTSLDIYSQGAGVIWIKSAPGGKLSNINGNFSELSPIPSPYMAVRHNTMHHFSRLVVSQKGCLRVESYGIVGDGSPPVVVDSFQIVAESPVNSAAS